MLSVLYLWQFFTLISFMLLSGVHDGGFIAFTILLVVVHGKKWSFFKRRSTPPRQHNLNYKLGKEYIVRRYRL